MHYACDVPLLHISSNATLVTQGPSHRPNASSKLSLEDTLALGHLPDVDTTDAHPQASLSFHSHYGTGVCTQMYVPLQMHADSVSVCADAC